MAETIGLFVRGFLLSLNPSPAGKTEKLGSVLYFILYREKIWGRGTLNVRTHSP